eukprot:13051374-Alexandrium_andersonii.AAC.1
MFLYTTISGGRMCQAMPRRSQADRIHNLRWNRGDNLLQTPAHHQQSSGRSDWSHRVGTGK